MLLVERRATPTGCRCHDGIRPRRRRPASRAIRVLLQQAVLNVINNAIDAVAEVPLPRRVVSIRTTGERDGQVRVMVRDYGTGLPPGAEQQVFEPFFSTKTTGVGMGLAISRSIVENHGGWIAAANDPDGGTLVTISLPAVA